MFELVFVALVVVALFGAAVRALASGGRRDELEPPIPLVHPGPRRSRFAGESLGDRR